VSACSKAGTFYLAYKGVRRLLLLTHPGSSGGALLSLLHGQALMYAVKKIPAELRRAAVAGIIGALLATAVIYSRNDPPAEVAQHSSKQAFQQPKDRPQAEGWFTPTPRAPVISDDKGAGSANAFPLPRARPVTPGFYYELVREQGDGEGNYVLVERQCIPRVDMPEPCYVPERGRRNFPLRRD
jgi:hypothetical protein